MTLLLHAWVCYLILTGKALAQPLSLVTSKQATASQGSWVKTQKWRTKNKEGKELKTFSLYWKQITSIYSWNRLQTFFIHLQIFTLSMFPSITCENNSRTVPKAYLLSTALSLQGLLAYCRKGLDWLEMCNYYLFHFFSSPLVVKLIVYLKISPGMEILSTLKFLASLFFLLSKISTT